MSALDDFVTVFFNPVSAATVAPLILKGAWLTLQLAIAIIPLALVLGLAIAIARDFGWRPLDMLLAGYVDILRSLPPLVLIIYLYSALPFLGLELDEFATVWAALVLNGAAFFAEIFRAGLEAVPRGQREAARATGLGEFAIEFLIVVPQGVRRVVPPVASNIIELTKATALGSVVALPELLRSARIGQSIVYDATPLVMAAALYLAVLWPLVRLLGRFEHRVTFRRRR
jgi:polar amino acid transport system permease protein